jgi:hypothetical protein
MFDPSKCNSELWCGKGEKPSSYRNTGTRYECMKVGYGRGYWDLKRKTIPVQSLDNIPYLNNEAKEILFDEQIETVLDFVDLINSFSNYNTTKNFLENELGYLTRKRFNSVVMFLFNKGVHVTKLPKCKD